MHQVIGEILPTAVAIAVSPAAVIAAIMMLLSKTPKRSGLMFLLGAFVGVLAIVAVTVGLGSLASGASGSGGTVHAVIQLILGILLLGLAWKKAVSARHSTAGTSQPRWMSGIDGMSAWKAGLLGLALFAINPKNLVLSVSAGVEISAASGTSVKIAASLVFAVIAVCSIAVPVVAYVVAPRAMSRPLKSLRTWLTDNNAVIMIVVLAVIGFVLLGKGIAGL